MNSLDMDNNKEETSERIIKAKKLKDGFTFKLSIDHIIEQTLLKQYNSPKFRKSRIQIEDTATSDAESDDSESTKPTVRTKGVPIKLQLKRQYAEDPPSSSDSDSLNTIPCYGDFNNDEPLDMSTKKVKKELPRPLDMITAIPPGWIMRGLSREDHMKFQSAVSKASCSPYQRENSH